MVLFRVENEIYDIDDFYFIDSKTINDIYEYEYDTIIDLDISKLEWIDYLNFILYNGKSLNALKMIEYLKNKNQLKLWYLYQREEGLSNDEISELLKITRFTLIDIDPIFDINKFDELVYYLNELSELSDYQIEYIFKNILEKPFLYKIYKLSFIKNFDEMKKITADYANLIIYKAGNKMNKNDNEINKRICENARLPKYIVDNKYYNNIYIYNNNLITCPDEYPFLGKQNTLYVNIQPSLCCFKQYQGRNKLNILSSEYESNFGYNTGLNVNNYQLITYNIKTLNGRDYYIFKIIEFDPQNKKLYAISI